MPISRPTFMKYFFRIIKKVPGLTLPLPLSSPRILRSLPSPRHRRGCSLASPTPVAHMHPPRLVLSVSELRFLCRQLITTCSTMIAAAREIWYSRCRLAQQPSGLGHLLRVPKGRTLPAGHLIGVYYGDDNRGVPKSFEAYLRKFSDSDCILSHTPLSY